MLLNHNIMIGPAKTTARTTKTAAPAPAAGNHTAAVTWLLTSQLQSEKINLAGSIMPSRNIFELHKAECKVTFHAETTHGESMGIHFKHLHCAPAVLRQSFPPQLSPGMAMEQPGTQKLEPNFVANDCNRITVHVSSTGSSTNTLTSKSKLWCA